MKVPSVTENELTPIMKKITDTIRSKLLEGVKSPNPTVVRVVIEKYISIEILEKTVVHNSRDAKEERI